MGCALSTYKIRRHRSQRLRSSSKEVEEVKRGDVVVLGKDTPIACILSSKFSASGGGIQRSVWPPSEIGLRGVRIRLRSLIR
ncbi:hypothetical protein LIER_42463 [Lithospermum erythrorhizon]|uniref:Uncharacterized protein n=1 Tax=Lithospermum erythrorhizon TaxID=34254 RepID=A0AAV3RRV6_LITER